MSSLTIVQNKGTVTATGTVVEEFRGTVEGAFEYWTGTIVGGHFIEASFEQFTADLEVTVDCKGLVQGAFELFSGYLQGGQQIAGSLEPWTAELYAFTDTVGSVSAELPLFSGTLNTSIDQIAHVHASLSLWSADFNVTALLVNIKASFSLFTGSCTVFTEHSSVVSASLAPWFGVLNSSVSTRADLVSSIELWQGTLSSATSEQILRYREPYDYFSN